MAEINGTKYQHLVVNGGDHPRVTVAEKTNRLFLH